MKGKICHSCSLSQAFGWTPFCLPQPPFSKTLLCPQHCNYILLFPLQTSSLNFILHPLFLYKLHLQIKTGLKELDRKISKAEKVLCWDHSGRSWAKRGAFTTKGILVFSWINILFFLRNTETTIQTEVIWLFLFPHGPPTPSSPCPRIL